MFERDEVLTQAGRPYSVFTLQPRLAGPAGRRRPAAARGAGLRRTARAPARRIPGGSAFLQELGFQPTNLRTLKIVPGSAGAYALLRSFTDRMDRYDTQRDLPAVKGQLPRRAPALRHRVDPRTGAPGAPARQQRRHHLAEGTGLARVLLPGPGQLSAGRPGRELPARIRIAWESGPLGEQHFTAWCEGRTGYPLVDAAMAQLNRTGYMHNRLRMVSASFLCKDLGIDWRRGERYFAQQLNDYELASNNGGWQWASSSGCDAALVPHLQSGEPVGTLRRRWKVHPALPAAAGAAAPARAARTVDGTAGGPRRRGIGQGSWPLVDHAEARGRAAPLCGRQGKVEPHAHALASHPRCLAAAAARRVAGHARGAAPLAAGGRQAAARLHALDQPLLACHAGAHGTRPEHGAAALRAPLLPGGRGLPRPPPGGADQRRPQQRDAAAGAVGGRLPSRPAGPAGSGRHFGAHLAPALRNRRRAALRPGHAAAAL